MTCKIDIKEAFSEGFRIGRSCGMDAASWSSRPEYDSADDAWIGEHEVPELHEMQRAADDQTAAIERLTRERDDALVSVTLLASDTAPDDWTRLSTSSFVRHATEGDPPNFRCARFWLDAPRGVWLWSVGWRSPAGVLTVGESATPVGAMRAADDASLDAEQRYGPPGNYACEHENDTSPCSGRMEWHYWPCPVLNRAEAVSLCRKHHMQWHREEDEIVHHDPDPALDADRNSNKET